MRALGAAGLLSVLVVGSAWGQTDAPAWRVGDEWTYFLYISAQNQDTSGSVVCDILVDGVSRTTATSTGAYVVAECTEAAEP